jgi:hypothetical protein
MQHNTRRLVGSIGSECLCRNCVSRGSPWKQYVKAATRRSVRRSARAEIMSELASDADHNADADYRLYVGNLTIECVRNLRSVRN